MLNNQYACLAAREFPVQSWLRLRPELRQKAVAVLHGDPPGELVCSLNSQARALGVSPGMTKVETDLFPNLCTLSRSALQEAAARQALLECAGCFSPLVEDQSSDYCFLCVADISGTETLFGPANVLAERLRKQAQALGIQTSIAVSSNFHAAVCLALGNSGSIQVCPPGMERAALAPLPLSVLALSLEQTETFSSWGIHTLGELANLKEVELITRLGQPGKHLHMLARGEAPHIFRPIESCFLLEERLELDSPVDILESLLFLVGVLLDQLIARVVSRILALASITLELGLEDGSTHTRTVRPALPTTDRLLWLKLTHLDLQANPPTAGIRSLTLHGQPGSTRKIQLGLFSPQVPEPTSLDVTLARIRSIVGEQYVGSAELNDTHRPDSFRMTGFRVPANTPTPQPEEATAQRIAMRQLRPAETVTVGYSNQRPTWLLFRGKRYQVERAYGPWSSCGDWWKPTLWSVEQWDVVAIGPEPMPWLCCCLTHDLTLNCWQMDALYD